MTHATGQLVLNKCTRLHSDSRTPKNKVTLSHHHQRGEAAYLHTWPVFTRIRYDRHLRTHFSFLDTRYSLTEPPWWAPLCSCKDEPVTSGSLCLATHRATVCVTLLYPHTSPVYSHRHKQKSKDRAPYGLARRLFH